MPALRYRCVNKAAGQGHKSHMTALKKYQKLESTGLWRESARGQRREVIVNFGEASLVLSDPRSENALSHWSLPAVERLNPGEMPATLRPRRRQCRNAGN